MQHSLSLRSLAMVAALAMYAAPRPQPACADSSAEESITLLVMDPLAAPLSCPCVEGYAQRKYEVLGEYLSRQLGKKIVVTFAESIKGALKKESVDRVHLIVGKDSVVRAQGREHDLNVKLLGRLVGKDGTTTQTGLVVVPAADAAESVADLEGYRILFGPPECDEKFAAARTLLQKAGVELPAKKDAE
ncbi:MAG: PhnD/SsuA/transferrin family substrate-binding protein, partial [Planctomycetota bacterium]